MNKKIANKSSTNKNKKTPSVKTAKVSNVNEQVVTVSQENIAQENDQIVLTSNNRGLQIFNWAVFKQTFFSQLKMWLIITFILALVAGIMAALIPGEISGRIQDIFNGVGSDGKKIPTYEESINSAEVAAAIASLDTKLNAPFASMAPLSPHLLLIEASENMSVSSTMPSYSYLYDKFITNEGYKIKDNYEEFGYFLTFLKSISSQFASSSKMKMPGSDIEVPMPNDINTAFNNILLEINTIDNLTKASSLFAYKKVLTSIDQTVVSAFVSMLGTLMGMVYAITICNSLICSQVDRGSMAYVLSTPIKRTTVVQTQILYYVTSVIAMCLLLYVVVITCLSLGGATYDAGKICIVFLGFALFMLAIGSISFIFSCTFNLTKYSLLYGAGIPVIFYVLSIISQVNEVTEPFKYLSLNTLFNSDAISNVWGEVKSGGSAMMRPGSMSSASLDDGPVMYVKNVYWWFYGTMFVIAASLFTGSIFVFKKRDLPL